MQHLLVLEVVRRHANGQLFPPHVMCVVISGSFLGAAVFKYHTCCGHQTLSDVKRDSQMHCAFLCLQDGCVVDNAQCMFTCLARCGLLSHLRLLHISHMA